jgi:GntR family transcriptional regulator
MTTTPNIGAGVSRYIRLYSVLSQALVERRIGVGEPLPSEPRLMRDYAVSRSTVRRALARLEAEGRIVRKRGSGTYARDGGQAAAPSSLAPVPDGVAGPPATTASRMLAFERIPTPGFLPDEQPGFGGTTLLIRQIRYIERQAVMLETAYVPEEIGERLTRRRLGSEGGAILTVLATLGHRSSSLEREFAALAADPFAANSLGLAVGAPVLNVRVLARNSQRRVLAYINLCCRPDRYEARTAIELGEQRRERARRRS